MLLKHPEVYVPKYRKELRFFDENYYRGFDWYLKFFPKVSEAKKYKAIGEITPFYFYSETCLNRILKMPSIQKLILLLRNPVDRAYSHYGCLLRDGQYTGSFESCLKHHPDILKQSFYAEPLKKYLQQFRREQLLVLIYENTVAGSLSKTKSVLARFLEIDEERFPTSAGTATVNAGGVPTAHTAYLFSSKIADHLKEWECDAIVSLAKKLGIKRVFGKKRPLPRMEEQTRNALNALYKKDIQDLQTRLGIELACWK